MDSSERRLSPQRLVHYRDNWYLDAWCHLRKGLRTFALDSIESVLTLDTPARSLSQQELDEHYSSAYGIFSGKADNRAVLRFDADSRGEAVLTVSWEILDKGGRQVRPRKRAVFRETVGEGDYPAVVGAMSRALANFSRDLAAEIATLP